ncbi:MAG: cytidine deaminase [Bacteroidota bacterium]
MEQKNLSIQYSQYQHASELPEIWAHLLQDAHKSIASSYAPYSDFHVGAAVLLENDIIVCGSNQENAAYPLGLCAERVALFAASSHYPGVKVKAIAITAHTNSFVIENPISPCGACRQVMIEYENLHQQNIVIILSGETGPIWVFEDAVSILPFSFNSKNLSK